MEGLLAVLTHIAIMSVAILVVDLSGSSTISRKLLKLLPVRAWQTCVQIRGGGANVTKIVMSLDSYDPGL